MILTSLRLLVVIGPGYIDAADIDIEGFILLDDIGLFLHDLSLDAVLVNGAHLVGISLDALFDDAVQRLIVYGCADLSVEERLGFFLDGRIFFYIRLAADGAFDILQHLLVVLLVDGGLHAECIVLDIRDIFRAVIGAHDHDHVVSLVAGAAYLLEHPAGAEHIVASESQRDADQDAEYDTHDVDFVLQELQAEEHAEEHEQCHAQHGDVGSGDHAAGPHGRDENNGHQKFDEDEQLARQVMRLLIPARMFPVCMSSRMRVSAFTHSYQLLYLLRPLSP